MVEPDPPAREGPEAWERGLHPIQRGSSGASAIGLADENRAGPVNLSASLGYGRAKLEIWSGAGRQWRVVGAVAAVFATMLSFHVHTASAQAKPITAYRGTIGGAAVEVLLIHDWQLDGMSGYLFSDAERMPVPLEKTPYVEDEGLLINVLGDPKLPTAALALQPAVPGAKRLRGRSIDLRSREQQDIRLERVVRFSSDQGDAYDGELLQVPADERFYFRVHARKARGEHGGRVDTITVFDLARGQPVQVIDGLDLFFSGTDTLALHDFNGDGVLDFSVMPMRPDDPTRTARQRDYYIYGADTGYVRNETLGSLAAQGDLKLGEEGRVSLRPQDGIDYGAGTIQWRHYRFVTPTRLERVGESEERF